MIVHGMQQKSHSNPPGQGHSIQPVFGAEGLTIDVVELLAIDGSAELTSSLESAKAAILVEAIFSLRRQFGLVLLELLSVEGVKSCTFDVRDAQFLKVSLSSIDRDRTVREVEGTAI